MWWLLCARSPLCRNKINYNLSLYELAWFDAAAIYLAVLIVSGFSAFVDWRKETEFVKRSQQDEDAKYVSIQISPGFCDFRKRRYMFG